MIRSLTITVLLAAGATGCVEGDAMDNAMLLVPDDVALHWDASYNGEADGLAAVIPVDVMVYGSESGEPWVDAELFLQANDRGTRIVHSDAVLAVEPESCADCGIVWDAWRDLYVAVDPALDGEDTLVLHTDEDGVARVYLVVDTFPGNDGADFAAVPVLVSMDTTEETFHIVPQ